MKKAKNKECKNCGKASVLSTAEEGRGALEFFSVAEEFYLLAVRAFYESAGDGHFFG